MTSKDEQKTDLPPQSGEEEAPEAAAGVKRPASSSGEAGVAKKVASGKQSFKGSCHCGYIKYTADFDPSNLNATRCNCTFCQKLSTTNMKLEDSEKDFKLISPSSVKNVDDYAPKTAATESGNADGHRYFCGKCGVHVWGEGWYSIEGQRFDHFAVNLATIDQPQEGIDLSLFKLKYFDGLHDNWFAELKETPYSGGLP